MRLALIAILAASVPAFPLLAQAAASLAGTASPLSPAAAPVDAGEGRAVAIKLADQLVNQFVFRDQAESYAAMLRKNAAAGRYDEGTREELARRLTGDLQAVHKDGHLHVEVADHRNDGGGANAGPPRDFPPLIQAAKIIAPGIGYIRFSAFFSTDEEVAAVRKWLAENRHAKTLIFDLRNHHGGRLAEQDVIFSYLYSKQTPLVRMEMAKAIYDEHGSPMQPGPTLAFATEGDKVVATHSALPGEDTALRKAKVYLLVSNKTASAAEHFSLALKSTGRATLIGEPTAGANHFGGGQDINEHFAVWMPIGRTYDIKTGKDWEGAGVAPDIVVDPKQALIVALEKAGVSHAEAVRLDAQEVPAEPVHSEKLRAR
jgi:Peptidase family S41/N-terminal domain of Peptidase_S41 in eukaryotic IRBP